MQRQRAGIAFEYPLRSELPGRAQVEIVVAVLEVSKWQHDRSNEDVPVGKIGSLAIRARYRGVGRVGFRPKAVIGCMRRPSLTASQMKSFIDDILQRHIYRGKIMPIRNGNYAAFYVAEPFSSSALGAHATADFIYYNQLRMWKGTDTSFPFVDSHDKTCRADREPAGAQPDQP